MCASSLEYLEDLMYSFLKFVFMLNTTCKSETEIGMNFKGKCFIKLVSLPKLESQSKEVK